MDEIPKKWTACHRFARIAPRKVRVLLDILRGRRCDDAMAQLQFNPRRGAKMLQVVLKSAMANADEAEADMHRLFVRAAFVDGGPYYRRWRPKDRGRAHPIAKRTSHITLELGVR